MKVFKASYSTLSFWAKGDYDKAIEMYFKVSKFDNEAMRLGRALHDEWEKEIKASGRMPQVFGGRELPADHAVEVFARKMVAPWLELRGKLDLRTPDTGYDWKSGTTPSTQYANGYQHKIYQILYPAMTKFEYHAFNPYVKRSQAVTVSIVHLTPKTLEEGVEWLVTQASEMKNYIEVNNLEQHFAKIPGARVEK